MTNYNPYLLSSNEQKVISFLNNNGNLPSQIVKLTKIPNASCYLAFQKLCKRGLANSKKISGKTFWYKNQSRNLLFDNKKDFQKTQVFVFYDKIKIKEKLLQIASKKYGTQIYTIEGKQNNAGWDKIFTKEETIKFNKELSRNKIVCESIIPESFFEDNIEVYKKEWGKSYKDRPVILHLVEPRFIQTNTILIITVNSVLLLNAMDLFMIEIKNRDIIFLLKGLFKFAISKT